MSTYVQGDLGSQTAETNGSSTSGGSGGNRGENNGEKGEGHNERQGSAQRGGQVGGQRKGGGRRGGQAGGQRKGGGRSGENRNGHAEGQNEGPVEHQENFNSGLVLFSPGCKFIAWARNWNCWTHAGGGNKLSKKEFTPYLVVTREVREEFGFDITTVKLEILVLINFGFLQIGKVSCYFSMGFQGHSLL